MEQTKIERFLFYAGASFIALLIIWFASIIFFFNVEKYHKLNEDKEYAKEKILAKKKEQKAEDARAKVYEQVYKDFSK